MEGVSLSTNASKTGCFLNKEALDLVSVVVSVIFEFVRVKLVLQLLGSVNDNVAKNQLLFWKVITKYSLGESSFLENGGIGGISETEAITLGVSDLQEGILELAVTFEESDDADVFVFDELVEVGFGGEFLSAGSGLSTHVLKRNVNNGYWNKRIKP